MKIARLPQPEQVNLVEEFAGKEFGYRFVGWTFNAYNKGCVSQGCASAIYHSIGQTGRTDSQGQGGPWYRTEAESLAALYNALAERYEKNLTEIATRIRKSR